jgi:hypothetical protein
MALTPQAIAALHGLDDVDWSTFSKTDSSAVEIPVHLRGLLEEPDSGEAEEAGVFLVSYLVCQGVHFEQAAVEAIPFMVRLLAAPGVSQRGKLLAALISMIRISTSDSNREVEPALKHECLRALSAQANVIVDACSLLADSPFFDELAVLVATSANAIQALPATVVIHDDVKNTLAAIAELTHSAEPSECIAAWVKSQSDDIRDWLRSTESIFWHKDEWAAAYNDSENDDEKNDLVPFTGALLQKLYLTALVAQLDDAEEWNPSTGPDGDEDDDGKESEQLDDDSEIA